MGSGRSCSTLPRRGLLALALWLGASANARAQDGIEGHYDPHSPAWNGLSSLLAAAAEQGVTVNLPERLDLADLEGSEALLVLYPTRPVSPGAVSRFVRAGGRLAVADDYGRGEGLLKGFQIGRGPAPQSQASRRLRGNPNVVVATPHGRHPLTRDVRALVTNHPQVLHHAQLQPVFSLQDGMGALVLAGAVGTGRLIVVGDPSLLINNMLEFRGNRLFARNLIEYLTEEGARPLVLIAPHTHLSGRFGESPFESPLHAVREGLGHMAEVSLPPLAVLLTTVGLCLVLLVSAATALPRRSAYSRAPFLRRPRVGAGFAGRTGFFQRASSNQYLPLMAYRNELRVLLQERLGVPGHAFVGEFAAALSGRGLDRVEVEQARRLLGELDALQLHQERVASAPGISPGKLHDMVERGQRLIQRLDESGSPR